jgi:ADP-heptose:LPS heptosyltransferase
MTPLIPPAASLSLVKGVAAASAAIDACEPLELIRIAYENHHAAVFHAWLDMADDERCKALCDRYVFLSVSSCAGTHLANLARVDREQAKRFVHELVDTLDWLGQGRVACGEEWFHGLERLAGAFTEGNFLLQARSTTELAFRTGAQRFPRLAQALAVHAAYLDAMVGRREEAAALALRLVRRPYLLPNRRDLPRLYQKLMYVLAGSNHLAEYRQVLWKGMASLHARSALSDVFVDQIVKTYRGAWRALLSREAPLVHRLVLLLGNAARLVGRVPPLAALRLQQPLHGLRLGVLYLLDRVSFLRMAGTQRRPALPTLPRRVLVTRAMGGLGDLLMMTPGLQALARGSPGLQIDFAIPKAFHAVLDGLQGVRLLDINEEAIDLTQYRRWVNLTDCPAGRREAQQSPNVRDNRIEIFAQAMGVSKWRLRRGVGFLPFFRVRDDESNAARQALAELNPRDLPVIGVQPFAADTYRNWPHMQALVARLAEHALVLVFHHETFAGFEGTNVVKVVRPLRQSVALLARCERAVVLDSSFLHFAAALGLPAVAIFGAISGRVRTRDYP